MSGFDGAQQKNRKTTGIVWTVCISRRSRLKVNDTPNTLVNTGTSTNLFCHVPVTGETAKRDRNRVAGSWWQPVLGRVDSVDPLAKDLAARVTRVIRDVVDVLV
jgi:hypothetical protein